MQSVNHYNRFQYPLWVSKGELGASSSAWRVGYRTPYHPWNFCTSFFELKLHVGDPAEVSTGALVEHTQILAPRQRTRWMVKALTLNHFLFLCSTRPALPNEARPKFRILYGGGFRSARTA